MSLNRAIFNKSLYARISEIWFAGLPKDAVSPPEHIQQTRWFVRDAADRDKIDDECKREFAEALAAIGPAQDGAVIARELVHEIEAEKDSIASSQRALSIILLLDQIPRNSFRDKQTLPHVYAHYDPIARSVLRHVLARTPRADLAPPLRSCIARRMWFYMPLKHSEERSDHARFVELFADMVADVRASGNEDEESAAFVQEMSGFEKKHKEIVERFGRYPYRNAVLGRESTEEELEWLKKGESFGVDG